MSKYVEDQQYEDYFHNNKYNYQRKKWVVATGTCNKYFYDTQQMIYSLRTLLPRDTVVIIYDNGLTENQINIFKTKFDFFNIVYFRHIPTRQERASYQVKSFAHEFVKKDYSDFDVYMWLDSKTTLKYNHIQLSRMLDAEPVWGYLPVDKEVDWTDPRTMNALELSEEDRQSRHIQSSAMMFDMHDARGKSFFYEYLHLTWDINIIAPQGSTKGFTTPSHRQDQSLLSCLMKKRGFHRTITHFEPWAVNHNTIHLVFN